MARPLPANAGGNAVSLANATDPNGYTLSYDATSLPAGLTINHSTGLISGTVSCGDAAAFGGVYPVTVVVADSGGASASEKFNWTVTDTVQTPVLNTTFTDQTSINGDVVSLQVNASQPQGDQIIYDASGLPSGLSIDSLSGLISGTIDGSASPTNAVIVTATDQGVTASESFNWTVSVNHAPTLTAPSDQTNAAGDTPSLTLSGTDAPGNTLTYSASGLPDGLSIADPSTGVISGTLQNDAASATPYLVTATVSDGTASASATFNWTVNFVGVTNPSDQYNTAGDTVQLPITATDATNVLPTFSAVGLPPGLSIDTGSGVIAGTIAPTAGSDNPYAVTVTATDGVNSNNTSFNWYVAVPVLTDLSNVEGDAVSFQAPAPTDASPTYSAVNLPNGISINSSTGQISGTLAVGDAANGPYAVTVTTTYGDGTSSSQSFNWTVTAVDTTAPVLTNPGSQTSIAGTQVSVDLSAPNSDGDSLTYDATGLPDGLTIDPDTGLVSGTPAEDAIQPYGQPVTETVTDGFGNSASQTFNWTVQDSTLIVQGDALSATEGAGAIFTVATFTDPDLNRQATDYTASINWGDGTTSDGWVDGSNGSYTVSGDHAYLHPGSLPVQVTITDPAGGSTTVVETASIAEVALTATGGFQEGEVNGLSPTLTVAVFSDPNTYDAASSYTATINWGDGTATASGVIDGEDGQFRVTGAHAYTASGTYTVNVTITDDDGTTATTTSTVTVGDIYANVAENVTAATFTENSLTGDGSTYTATINWGDGATTQGIVSGGQGGFSVAGTHMYAQIGLYTVKVTVVDAAGTTTVAYDNMQAVTAPATGYDGNVAVALNTASGTTLAVGAVPGAAGGGLVDKPQNQAYTSAGLYAVQTLINNPQGALVAAAVSGVYAYGQTSVTGPAVVPGNSKYTYIFNFPPVSILNFNPFFSFGSNNVKVTKLLGPNFTVTGLEVQATFANKAAIIPLTLTNWLRGVPNAKIVFPVTVVQIVVANPANDAAFTPNNVPFSDTGYGDTFGTGTKRAGVLIDSGIPGKALGLAWKADVTLNGPNGNQGLNKIQVGFIQHITTSVEITYKSGAILVAKYKGKPFADYVARLDHAKGATPPWYTDNPGEIIKGANNGVPVSISSRDTPRSDFPLTSDQLPVGVWSSNAWPGKDLITKITFINTFSLDVAARTTDASNNASSLYFAEASGDWSFDGSGAFKLNLQVPAKNSTLIFTADKNPAVVDAGAWTAVAAPRLENISNPSPADWFTARTFSKP